MIQLPEKHYIRLMDEQSALYEYFSRQHGLHSKSMQILLWVANYPYFKGTYITQKQLAQRTYSSKQVVNATIKAWRNKGYVMLLDNPKDKRHKLVSLTAEGQRWAMPIIQELNRIEQAAIAVLSEEEQDILNRLSAKYNTALKQEMEITYD